MGRIRWIRLSALRAPLVGTSGLLALTALACGDDATGPLTPSTEGSSVVVAASVVVAGETVSLMVELRDDEGRPVGVGGHAVAFTASGGSSTGLIGPTVDGGDGTFTSTFLGLGAGTATTIGATLDGDPIVTPLPTVRVLPGPAASETSFTTVTPRTVLPGEHAELELTARDLAGNVAGGGATVDFKTLDGTATGEIGPVQDHGDGRYTADFLATAPGTPLVIVATIDGSPVETPPPTLTVAGDVAAEASTLQLSSDTISLGSGLTATLRVRDEAGVPRTSGGERVVFGVISGPDGGTGAMGETTDHDDGSYTAEFTSTHAGTVEIVATLNGTPVPGPNPTVTILESPLSPQRSTVRIGADTIQAGDTVVFEAEVFDEVGDPVTSGIDVTFTLAGEGTSDGTLGPTTNHGDGVYSATFVGVRAGTSTEVGATLNDSSQIQMLDSLGVSHLPRITVVPGPASSDSSVVSVFPNSIALGDSASIVLRTRDPLGNRIPDGGHEVAFTRTGRVGASMGSIRHLVDRGDGTYSAFYVSEGAGTADTVVATLDGVTIATRPAITVVCDPGPASLARSLLTINDVTPAASPVQHVALPSGVTTTLTLRVRDSVGCPVTDPIDVVFDVSGGTSTGLLGPVTDQGDGTHTATYTGRIAGTANTVLATLDGELVTSEPATVTVVPGDISPTTSFLTVSPSEIDEGAHALVTLQAVDSAGNPLDRGGRAVRIELADGPSHGSLGETVDHGDGTYSALYTGLTAAPEATDAFMADIGGTRIRTPSPEVAVVAGEISAGHSTVTVSADSVAVGDSILVVLEGKDAAGRSLVTGDRASLVSVTLSDESAGVFGPVLNRGDGSYAVYLTGAAAVGSVTLSVTIDGEAVSTAIPSVRVVSGPDEPGG